MTFLDALSKRSGLGGLARNLWAETIANWRARIGLLVIGVLIGSYGLVVLHRSAAEQIAVYQQDSARLARLVAIAGEQEWPKRAEGSVALRAALENRLWTAESEGVAQADLQAWIADIGRDVGMPMFDIRVETSRPKDLPAGLRQITATITGQPSETAVIALLERIAQAPHLTVITRMHVRQQPSPVLELVLVGYARIGGARRSVEP